MDADTLESLRRKLLDRDKTLLQRRRQALMDEQQLLENREPGLEDLAANQTAAARSDAQAESDAIEVTRIQASLDRIAQGTFGDCVICHGAIETERLRAMPEAERCSGCTH